MDISTFYTMQNQSGAAQKAQGAGTNGAFANAFGGLDFMEFLMMRLLEGKKGESDDTGTPIDVDTAAGENDASGILQSDNPVLSADPSLNPAELLAASDEVTQNVETTLLVSNLSDPGQRFLLSLNETIAQNKQVFDEILARANALGVSEEEIFESLKTKDGKDVTFADLLLPSLDLQNPEQVKTIEIIVVNLTPAQITEIQQRAQGSAQDSVKDLMQNLTPDQKQNLQITQNSGQISGQTAEQNQGQVLQIQILAPQIQGQAVSFSERLSNLLRGVPLSGESGEFLAKFEALGGGAKNVETQTAQAVQAANGNTPGALNGNAPQAPSADGALSALQGWPFSSQGSLLSSLSWINSEFEEFGMPVMGAQNVTGLNAFTNLSTYAPSAALPHPGTAMVAATLQKAAGSGETKAMTLQLDPPELGRVEVRMEFGKDKSVKAHILAEKPETLVMLQRDAASLERALQDAGLEADGSSISFEMADDGGAFSQDGRHDGSRNPAFGPDGDDAGDEVLIESTMTWNVDPETGHMHYNILA